MGGGVIVYSLFLILHLVSKFAVAGDKPAEWTIFLYLAGDEPSLYEPSRRALKRIEKTPSLRPGGKVQVVAQWDDVGRDPNYRYNLKYIAHPTRQLGPDTLPLTESEIEEQLAQPFRYQELNSGSAVTLKNFLAWGIRAYPAKRYGLILSGHSWGQQGLMQDFYMPNSDGLNAPSQLMKNYEIRRAMEELYRENRVSKFDFLMVDACIAGQLELALEFQPVFRYFAASSLETPNHSFPFEQFLEPFAKRLESESSSDVLLEDSFFKPWVKSYLQAHVRKGALVEMEGQMDPVDAFVVRTDHLPAVGRALKNGLSRLSSDWKKRWHSGELKEWSLFADDDANADLFSMSKATPAMAELQSALGYPDDDSAGQRTLLDFRTRPNAAGVWAAVQIDEQARYRDMAVCLALKTYAFLNADQPEIIPRVELRKGEWESAAKLDCNHLAESHQTHHPDADQANPDGGPHPLITVFKRGVQFRNGTSAYWFEHAMGKRIADRTLILWIPKGKGPTRKVRLHLVGTERVDLTYSEHDHVGWQIPPYTFNDHFGRNALYVVEGHTNGVPLKHGLGILLSSRVSLEDSPYWQGREPIERREPEPYAWRVNTYLYDPGPHPLIEKDFYRAHRIQMTGWPDFLFGTLLR